MSILLAFEVVFINMMQKAKNYFGRAVIKLHAVMYRRVLSMNIGYPMWVGGGIMYLDPSEV